MKKGHHQVVFKPYQQDQLSLLPPSLEELIPPEHLVRKVNQVIEEMGVAGLIGRYKGGGASSFHPKMMLKVLVYGYTQRVYTSRRLAKALREDVNFMWLSGGNRPDFRTINRFRGEILKGTIDEVFVAVLEYLLEAGYVKYENYFVDGTKIESSANKYQWVWAKSTKRNHEKLEEKVRGLLKDIEEANDAENEEYGEDDLEELGEKGQGQDSEKLKQLVEKLKEKLKQEPKDRKLAKAVKTLEKDYLPRKEKYEEQEKIFQGRNSFAKTDPDATFMRMKEDHMRNGQLKPGYNVQIGTEGQFVVGYSLHQRPGDTSCLIPHLEKVRKQIGKLPKRVIGDAGYGSEENYTYLERKGVEGYLKYSTFDQEQKRSWRKKRFRVENFPYDPSRDEFFCPNQKSFTYQYSRVVHTDNGFETTVRQYACSDCGGCPWKEECTRSPGNRWIQVNPQLIHYRQAASERLSSSLGKKLRSQRYTDVETVFGRLKHNWGFRRFYLRGLEKVNVEWGLLSMAHNIAKMAAN
jgi:transposase